jgi:hypothetical protein
MPGVIREFPATRRGCGDIRGFSFPGVARVRPYPRLNSVHRSRCEKRTSCGITPFGVRFSHRTRMSKTLGCYSGTPPE